MGSAGPGEGIASYDITSEETPVGPLGYYVPDVAGPTDERPCTSHFGRFAPGTRVMSIGWYVAGTRIGDWSDPSNPTEVAAAVLAVEAYMAEIAPRLGLLVYSPIGGGVVRS